MSPTIHFTILCGGNGSRLWPLSRSKHPKQFLKLVDSFSLLQNTILRVLKMPKIYETTIQIICNQDHIFLVQEQIEELYSQGLEKVIQLIVEPMGRDSAPAIAITALSHDKKDYSIVLPCDHVFNDTMFIKCCVNALPFLESSIVTFGIEPTRIETGYGYIECSKPTLLDIPNPKSLAIQQFVEKPIYELAKKYFESGNFYWNAGVFLFKNEQMIECFKIWANELFEHAHLTWEKSNSSAPAPAPIIYLDSLYFKECQSISVDYAIMEPLCSSSSSSFKIKSRMMVYKGHWNDIGSFLSLIQEVSNNEKKEHPLLINSNECFVKTDYHNETNNKVIALIGCQDLVVVDTEDALLICNKYQTQDVKKVVDILKKSDKKDLTLFQNKVQRPWGYYVNIQGNDSSGSKVKQICVYPGKRLSLQSHNKRSEHWVITEGEAKVQVDDQFYLLGKNEHITIPLRALHRMENVGTTLLFFIETQIGEYLGEDDIVRYQDDFGRV
jgi:mannose-1-phosphate guanylyltransferase/mannose-6-phosphate isomerase